MLELSPLRRNKVNLADYNSQQDIENRIMLADFTLFEHQVLEEILFSSLKIPLKKFARSIDCTPDDLTGVIEKLNRAGLLVVEDDTLIVDKEMRKYFEFQISRFDPEFKPDMEFLQGLLKKVPIHLLPIWYAIPRTSSNIFESIVEKYLITPQIFTRYLNELHFGEAKINAFIRDVYEAPHFQISSSDLISRYNLSRHEFEELMIVLEFNFICCLSYVKEDDHWIELVSPFYEWRQYLLQLQLSQPTPLAAEKVTSHQTGDFAFIKGLKSLLLKAGESPVTVSDSIAPLAEKLQLVKLAEITDGRLRPTEIAAEFLSWSLENQASYLHRHPFNRIISYRLDPIWNSEKAIHEAEKSVRRVSHGEWVLFDDFLPSVTVSLDSDMAISLKKTGKSWRYAFPQYTDQQKMLIKATIFEWLFEAGMTETGSYEGKECFRVTDFGRRFFN